jgi:hypothetical protein
MRPRNWIERGEGGKNDRLYAAALRQPLARDERTNKNAFSTVRVPTADEERKTSISRQRE